MDKAYHSCMSLSLCTSDLQPRGLFSLRLCLLPVHTNGNHWCCGVIDFHHQTLSWVILRAVLSRLMKGTTIQWKETIPSSPSIFCIRSAGISHDKCLLEGGGCTTWCHFCSRRLVSQNSEVHSRTGMTWTQLSQQDEWHWLWSVCLCFCRLGKSRMPDVRLLTGFPRRCCAV